MDRLHVLTSQAQGISLVPICNSGIRVSKYDDVYDEDDE